jgi:hypothetical protein
MNLESVLKENSARLSLINQRGDPRSGLGCGDGRVELKVGGGSVWLPEPMFEEPMVVKISEMGWDWFVKKSALPEEFLLDKLWELRRKHDFEFWCWQCVKILDKESKKLVRFELRPPQRRLLEALERMRIAGVPIRVILLKARQWGGSTLVQVYMAWIQQEWRRNWHSAIIGDVEQQSKNIRGMYKKLADNFPRDLGSITFVPYEGQQKVQMIAERGCIVGIGSAKTPDAFRSYDFSMLHMSEVGLWKETEQRSPEDLAQALAGALSDAPYTLCVKESTAKGVGNYFHRQWTESVAGRTRDVPVFVSWYDIDLYTSPVDDYQELWESLDSYERDLWDMGATLEGIQWYRLKLSADMNGNRWRMCSEFPSNAEEAFQTTGYRAFSHAYTSKAAATCRPAKYVGDIYGASQKGADALNGVEFRVGNGPLKIWELPDAKDPVTNRYALFADIGGRTDRADYSVIRVLDRYWMKEGGVPEIVATWRGHLDQDLFAWKCAQLAKFYRMGLLAVEVNSLRPKEAEEHHLTVLDEIAKYYRNLFARTDPEKLRQGVPARYGFHMNSATKPMIIDTLNGALRDGAYIERDQESVFEMQMYEIKTDGTMGAVEGQHDDLVIGTAGAVWLAIKHMGAVKDIKPSKKREIYKTEAVL